MTHSVSPRASKAPCPYFPHLSNSSSSILPPAWTKSLGVTFTSCNSEGCQVHVHTAPHLTSPTQLQGPCVRAWVLQQPLREGLPLRCQLLALALTIASVTIQTRWILSCFCSKPFIGLPPPCHDPTWSPPFSPQMTLTIYPIWGSPGTLGLSFAAQMPPPGSVLHTRTHYLLSALVFSRALATT